MMYPRLNRASGTTLSKRRGVVVEGGRPDDSRNCLEPSTSIPLIEFHAPSAEERKRTLQPSFPQSKNGEGKSLFYDYFRTVQKF